MEARALKWWGWGFEDVTVPIESRPILSRYLRDRLEIDVTARSPVVPIESIRIPPSILSPEALAELRTAIGPDGVSVLDRDRLDHAAGRGYRDLVRLRAGRIDRYPDAILYPGDEGAVRRLLDLAGRRGYAVVPYGGGTSVVGGIEPPLEDRFVAALTLDMRRIAQVRAIDRGSRTATVEAGIRGPALEEALRGSGLTFPHVPQSWEFSTLGGWIATRAAGGLSNRYGTIEDLVAAVRLVAPARTLDLPALPREAHGPALRELILGSEGTLGVITCATIRVHAVPAERRFGSRLFPSFADGLEAVRRMAQEDALPDMAYLSDEEETRFGAAAAGISADRPPSHDGPSSGALLLMSFEGSRARVAHRQRQASAIARPSMDLGARPARRWQGERLRLPYLRDAFLDVGLLVETVETAVPWSRVGTLYDAARAALGRALGSGGPSLVLCHASHAYVDGVSLYFTFLARPRPGEELALWDAAKASVTNAILDAGGALSHHHGIGADHAPYLGRMIGEDGLVVLRALKRELDPEGIMNPGKLVAGTR